MDKKVIQIPISEYDKFDRFDIRSKYMYNIRTEGGEIVPYKMNQAQEILYKIENEEFQRTYDQRGKAVCKYLLLKSRQIGGTTHVSNRNYDMSMVDNNTYGIVLAHDDEGTNVLWKKYENLWSNYPDVVQFVDTLGEVVIQLNTRPTTKNESGKRLRYSSLTNSDFSARTAGGGDSVGKGDTLNFIHLSEAANFQHYEDIKSSADPQVRSANKVYYVIESTANGMNGKGAGFYEDWVKNEKEWKRYQRGETPYFEGFRPVFIPWYYLEKYTYPLYKGHMIDLEGVDFYPINKKKFLEREEMLKEDYNLTLEQLNFYRAILKSDAQYKLVNAYRYYPTFAEEAFQATSQCFFDSNRLFIVKKEHEDGTIIKKQKKYTIESDGSFREADHGELTIWEEPEPNWVNRYFLGVDQSRGKEDGDYTSMYIFDKLKNKFCAHWYGNVQEHMLVEPAMFLGRHYNNAKMIPEANLSTFVNMIRPDGPYPYDGEIIIQEVSNNGSIWYGVALDKKTRKDVLFTYLDWLEPKNGAPKHDRLPDADTVDEHLSFVRKVTANTNTKFEADDKKHDDRVMSIALSVYGAIREEEEMYKTDDDKTDIVSIITPMKRVGRGVKHNKIGFSTK